MSESEQREIEEKYDLRNAPSRYSGSEAICWSIGAVTAATAMVEKKNAVK